MKKVCVLGANSYIGMSFERWITEEQEDYLVYTIDTLKADINEFSFSNIDIVLCVIGIAHKKVKNKSLYYKVNRDLVINCAKKAKKEGVKQFIVLSSMSIFGKNTGRITRQTTPVPVTDYGKSKLEADNYLLSISNDKFKVCIVRPPMVYGKNCKGNYQLLRKFALISPLFLKLKNQRSMIYIDNLSYFFVFLMNTKSQGIFYPQNPFYTNTTEMVKLISKSNCKKIICIPFPKKLLLMLPINKIKKVFGDLVYDFHDDIDYPYTSLKETINLSEL